MSALDPQLNRRNSSIDREQIAAGVAAGIRQLLEDDDLVKKFWERGYTQLTQHGTNAASQWVGKRLLTALVVAITVAGITWLVKTGALR